MVTENTRDVDTGSNRRLDSWKEIASYFGHDVRTVRRWEKERALPVYRPPGKARGSVYAFTGELARWLEQPSNEAESSTDTNEAVPNDELALPAEEAIEAKARWSSKRLYLALAVVMVAVLALGGWVFRSQLAHTISARPRTPPSLSSNTQAATELYLKGRYEWSKRTAESLNQAVDYFTQAIVRDPGYAQAYAGLADTYNLLREYSNLPDDEAYVRSMAAAKKAVELDDSLSEAHRALAFDLFNWSWDCTASEREFKRAIELNPSDPDAHHWYANSLLMMGRLAEAQAEIERARQLDPSSDSIAADRASILFDSGIHEEALAILHRIEKTNPGFRSPHFYLASIAFVSKDDATYLKETRKIFELQHDQAGLEIANEAEAEYAAGGATGMWKALLKAQEDHLGRGSTEFDLALTYVALGRKQDAIRNLAIAIDKHNPTAIGIRNDSRLRSLHGEPAFSNLLTRLHLPPL